MLYRQLQGFVRRVAGQKSIASRHLQLTVFASSSWVRATVLSRPFNASLLSSFLSFVPSPVWINAYQDA
jgi:hypothetical protein